MTTKKKHLSELEEDLAPWLPREKEMGKILSAAATASMTLDQEIEAVDEGLTIQEANEPAEIENIVQPLNITKKPDETLEEFRNRALQNFRQLTNSGSPVDILQAASTLFNVDSQEITIENITGAPYYNIQVENKDNIDPEFGSFKDILNLINKSSAANYSVNFLEEGTLEYVTPTELNNGNYDSAQVYATLDNNGDQTSGGTYSGYFLDSDDANEFRQGNLDYITPTNRANNNYDPAKGYATLDNNGDPTDGGSYSGYTN